MTASGLVCERCGAKEGGSRRCVCGGFWVEQDEIFQMTSGGSSPRPTSLILVTGVHDRRDARIATPPPLAAEHGETVVETIDRTDFLADPSAALKASEKGPVVILNERFEPSMVIWSPPPDPRDARIAALEAELREARALVDLKTNLTADVVAANKRAGAAEAETKGLRDDWRRALKRAHDLTLETQTMEDAVTDLCRIVLQEREQKHAAEAEAGRLRVALGNERNTKETPT